MKMFVYEPIQNDLTYKEILKDRALELETINKKLNNEKLAIIKNTMI